MTAPRLVVILSEIWTMTSPRDLRAVVRLAAEAEEAGADAVMLSEHVALGPSADAGGRMANPREYALPGNQAPDYPWPHSLTLLSAMAGATTRLRLVAGAIIAPLRHPVLLAKELATLDLLSEGRLVVLPTVSWHPDEYAALDVSFADRGELLDEHLAAWRTLWGDTPASFAGRHYSFEDVFLEPKPYRAAGPALWFGGSRLHGALLRRLVEHGQGWNPLGAPAAGEVERLAGALAAAGRDISELELVGGTRASFPDATSVADLDRALAAVPEQMRRGFDSFCLKPSQFTDDPRQVGAICRRAVARLAELAG